MAERGYRSYLEAHPGEVFGPVKYSLSRDSIERWLEEFGETNGRNYVSSTGQMTVPTGYWSGEYARQVPLNGYHFFGTIHARTFLQLFSPVMADTVVTSRGKILDKFQRRDREFIVVESVIEDEIGNMLVRCLTTIVVPPKESSINQQQV